MANITILDTTLRDGAQSRDISSSVSDKLAIMRTLDRFGVDYIECGNPASNPKDMEFFKAAANECLTSARLCAFGSTRHKDRTAVQDEGLNALLSAGTTVVSLFGKAWDMLVSEVLGVSPGQNLDMIRDSIAYIKAAGREVIFDAEHFFDGYKASPQYAMEVLRAAAQSGADILCLCDTNGGTLPGDIARICNETQNALSSGRKAPVLGIHTHNDNGCATANSLTALDSGIAHIQGTFIGFGERCGNACLSSIIPAIQLKTPHACMGNLPLLTETAARVAEISNVRMAGDQPYTGQSSFTHKAGMHIDGMKKHLSSFEHIDPRAVGNERHFLVSEVAGRGSILERIRLISPGITRDSAELAAILERVKELELFGYQFEAADASFELLARRILGLYKPHFSLVHYKTMDEFPAPDGEQPSTAVIKIDVDGRAEMAAAMGNGPVNALDIALRNALFIFYPQLSEIKLTDYKVRVLEQTADTAAKVRVLIETTDKDGGSWSTIGVSVDIIEASLIALIDSVEYRLITEDDKPHE